MILHAIHIISTAVRHLNPGQIPVVVVDQLLYAIAKQLQWSWPESHGEEKVVMMMGGLTIEMNWLKLLEDWIDGSGWTSSLVQADVTTAGRTDAMLTGAHVTRTRYAHQVPAASLHILQKQAYRQYLTQHSDTDTEARLSIEEWSDVQSGAQPQFKYWATTMKLHIFSAMALDQYHEQLNQLIKGDRVAVGSTENAQALERWMIAGPEISQVVL